MPIYFDDVYHYPGTLVIIFVYLFCFLSFCLLIFDVDMLSTYVINHCIKPTLLQLCSMYMFTGTLFGGRVDNIANRKASMTVVAINL